MKFRFVAVDGRGRVLRGVMRAESPEDAREIMLAEEVYPKQIEPAEEEEKATWAPRERIKARATGAATWAEKKKQEDERPVRAVFRTIGLFGTIGAGQAGLSDSGAFVFIPASGGEKFTVAAAELEDARVMGFPRRVLRLTLLDGSMHEFTAGIFLTGSHAKETATHLKKLLKESNK